jgi:hypothetical protein
MNNMVADINSTKKVIYEDNLRLSNQLKEAVDEINKLENIIKRYNKLMKIWGLGGLEEVTEFINKYKDHTCKCSCKSIDNLTYEDIKENIFYKGKEVNNQSVPTGHIDENITDNKVNIKIYNNQELSTTIPDVIINNNPLPTPTSFIENNNHEERPDAPNLKKSRNSSFTAIERYPVKIYEKTDSEILQFVSEENKIQIHYQYKISEKLNKNIEDIKIKDIIDFKIKYEGLNDNKDQRKKLRYKIERSKYLYEEFGEKLSRFKISLNYLADMSEKTWKEWLISFEDIVYDLYKDSNKCKYIYKNNKKCNKYDCKIRHNTNI